MSGRASLTVKTARLFQRLPLAPLRLIEGLFLKSPQQGDAPNTLFLMAVPRSGSTLTYQILCHGLKVNYLSNLSHLLTQLPVFGARVSKWKTPQYRSDFKSQKGFVPGLGGPAEGLRYWSYWGGYGLDERAPIKMSSQTKAKRLHYIKRSFAAIARKDGPVVTGYLGHSLCVDDLTHNFPDALFLRLHRDPVDTAMSLLTIRKTRRDDWFSVYPNECGTALGKTLVEQVSAQVYWLNRRLMSLPQERTFDVSYEDICRDPNAVIDALIAWASTFGLSLDKAGTLPETFERPSIKQEPLAAITDDRLAVEKAVNALETEFGALDIKRN